MPWWSPLAKGLSYFPFFFLYGLSNLIAFALQTLGYRRKVIENNLALAFPNMGIEEMRKTTTTFYKHVADIMVESIKSLSISPRALRKRVRMKHPELFEALHKEKKASC